MISTDWTSATRALETPVRPRQCIERGVRNGRLAAAADSKKSPRFKVKRAVTQNAQAVSQLLKCRTIGSYMDLPLQQGSRSGLRCGGQKLENRMPGGKYPANTQQRTKSLPVRSAGLQVPAGSSRRHGPPWHPI